MRLGRVDDDVARWAVGAARPILGVPGTLVVEGGSLELSLRVRPAVMAERRRQRVPG